jgi:hypothetical protein
MDDLTWIADLKALGAFGSILIIFALSIRFLIVSHSRSVTKREEAVINMTQETIKLVADNREVISLNTMAIKEHIDSMRKSNEVIDLEKRQIIAQIKRSEANLKKEIERNGKKA